MNAYKDRIAETERVEERKRARVEVQTMRLRYPGTEMMSRWRFDMRTHLGDIREKQHEEDRMRDTQRQQLKNNLTS